MRQIGLTSWLGMLWLAAILVGLAVVSAGAWRAASGRPLRLELDPHPSGHEVVLRAGEVRAYFRKPSEHWYTVTITNGSGEPLRGTVSVREGRSAKSSS